MELTEAMKRAGWRECPSQDLIDWKSGFWMVKSPIGPMLRDAARMKWETEVVDKWPHRPVNSETWDYDPRGWGEQPAPVKLCDACHGFGKTREVYKSTQDCRECKGMGYKERETKQEQPAPVMVPTKRGQWWWRKDVTYPCYISCDGEGKPLMWFEKTNIRGDGRRRKVFDDGQWLGPCVKPEIP